jgi:hypothetical protein
MRKAGEGTVFAAAKIGVFAPGVQFGWFQKLFQKAYGTEWGIHYGGFLQRVSMPKGSHPPMSAEEFATVQKWFLDEQLNHLNALVPEIPPPATCEDVVNDPNNASDLAGDGAGWLANHLDDMEFEGWGAINEENRIKMYGCSKDGQEFALECFSGETNEESILDPTIVDLRIIEVRDLGFNTSFWMRSSADGSLVGNGGRGDNESGFGATITDLLNDKDIGVKGSYDPGFFPNNKGFIMQGGGAGLCGQSVLTDEAAIADGIDFTEPGCSKAQGINLYQHVAVSLDGGDYFVINSEFTSDSGSGGKDPRAPFNERATMKFSPLVFSGADWIQKDSVVVKSPYEGDAVLSPSGRMVISRHSGPDGVALGYMLRRVKAEPNSQGTYDIDVDLKVSFICPRPGSSPGAKANISFDEKWMVTHHYEENGTANLYISHIASGVTTKVTNMPEGGKALFPHFRSDGWIYYLETKDGKDRAMATDAVLRAQATLAGE